MRRSLLLGLASFALLAGCKSNPVIYQVAGEINRTLDSTAERLLPGDVIEIRVPNAPQYDHRTQVALDGTVSFLGIPGEFRVTGMGLDILRRRLNQEYSSVREDPRVGLFINSVVPRTFTVFGEVQVPGEQEFNRNRVTLIDAIGRAGGPLNRSAKMERLVLIRWDSVQKKQLKWRLDASREYWGIGEPIFLQPYDIVYIPNRYVDKVGNWVDNYFRRLIPLPFAIPL